LVRRTTRDDEPVMRLTSPAICSAVAMDEGHRPAPATGSVMSLSTAAASAAGSPGATTRPPRAETTSFAKGFAACCRV